MNRASVIVACATFAVFSALPSGYASYPQPRTWSPLLVAVGHGMTPEVLSNPGIDDSAVSALISRSAAAGVRPTSWLERSHLLDAESASFESSKAAYLLAPNDSQAQTRFQQASNSVNAWSSSARQTQTAELTELCQDLPPGVALTVLRSMKSRKLGLPPGGQGITARQVLQQNQLDTLAAWRARHPQFVAIGSDAPTNVTGTADMLDDQAATPPAVRPAVSAVFDQLIGEARAQFTP